MKLVKGVSTKIIMVLDLRKFSLAGIRFFWIYLAIGIALENGVSGTEDSDAATKNSCNNTGLDYITHEKRLISCLMKDYDPTVRPALGPRQPVNVSLSSVILTITSLNEKTGVLTTDSWLKQTWVDVQLKWNAKDFDDLNEIRLPAEKLWNPQIVLFNNADESFRYVMDKLVVVNSTGHVTWIPHARLHSFCDLDLTLFPYDTQTCQLFLGSWTYEDTMVSLKIPDYHKFLPKTGEWDIVDFSVSLFKFSDDVKNYPTVVYSIRMKRVAIFYKYVLVAPAVLLACLTLMLFWIPVQSSERFMLATGILVSLSVLLVLLEGYLPTDLGKLPVIASYMGFNFILLVITVAISIIAMNCQYRGVRSGAVPSWIRWVFLGRLRRLMCINVRPYADSASLSMALCTEDYETLNEFENIQPMPPNRQAVDGGEASSSSLSRGSATSMEKTLTEIRRYLRYLMDLRGHNAPHSELVLNEWHQMALVVDRLAFWIFVCISFITTVVIFGHS